MFSLSFIFTLLLIALDQQLSQNGKSCKIKYLKHWLFLPHSATCFILNYPDVCCPSISLILKYCKLSLLTSISISSDLLLQELTLLLVSFRFTVFIKRYLVKLELNLWAFKLLASFILLIDDLLFQMKQGFVNRS